MTTTLTTNLTPAGIACALPDGTLIATLSYHAQGLYDVIPSNELRAMSAELYRMCDGLEAAEFYALCLASEFVRWRGMGAQNLKVAS